MSDLNREWTTLAINAEIDAHGTHRIIKAHNERVAALERELAEARASEKRAWDEAAQARVDGAVNIVGATEDLRAEVEAAVRWTVKFMQGRPACSKSEQAHAAWSRYQQERKA